MSNIINKKNSMQIKDAILTIVDCIGRLRNNPLYKIELETDRDQMMKYEKIQLQNNVENMCVTIKNQLNKIFFPDAECNKVMISNDTDKEFFGAFMSITRIGRSEGISNIFRRKRAFVEEISYEPMYSLDIDSRLLTNHRLEPISIAALIIRDIDVITSRQSLIEFCGMYDNLNPVHILKSPEDATNNYSVCEFILSHTLYTTQSVFFKDNDEICLATELLRANDMVDAFDEGFDIIQSMSDGISSKNSCKTLLLNWFVSTIKENNTTTSFKEITNILKIGYQTTDSIAMKLAIRKALGSLPYGYNKRVRYYDNTQMPVTESSKRGLIGQMKYNGMKSLEDDLFEYSMRVKNVDDENSAILLMRQINNRMGIICDYLESESDNISDIERKRWEKLYDKYDKVREEMVKKPIYSRKMYGLFVDYNALMNMNNPQNMMTMNTMY